MPDDHPIRSEADKPRLDICRDGMSACPARVCTCPLTIFIRLFQAIPPPQLREQSFFVLVLPLVGHGQQSCSNSSYNGGNVTRPREKSVKARAITSPVLSVDVDAEISRLKREPEWKSGREDGIALVKYPRMRVVLVALKSGTSVRQRKVEGPLSIYVVSGKLVIAAEKGEHGVQAKGLYTMRRGFLKEVHAMSNAIFLLTLFKLEP